MNQVLTCPKCQGTMRTHNRNGVMIEQCDMCRGIFLDYGELEALSRAGGGMGHHPQQPMHPPMQHHPGWGHAPPVQQQPWGVPRSPMGQLGGFGRMLFYSS